MFTGIIETLGIISDIKKDQGNVHLTIQTNITNELKIDQSVAHNGVCLTVVEIFDNKHVVTAIQETIDATRIEMTEEEAIVLWPKIKNWVAQTGEQPSIQSYDPQERRLAEAIIFLKEQRRKAKANE